MARFADGIGIPLDPFFGSMGVGRIDSAPPGDHAGLVAGTTLFIPVHARGALFEVGVDFIVTQAVDGTKGIHGLIPKSVFK